MSCSLHALQGFSILEFGHCMVEASAEEVWRENKAISPLCPQFFGWFTFGGRGHIDDNQVSVDVPWNG